MTFFANDAGELHALSEVARAAHERGYRVRLTDDPREEADIGYFSAARPDTRKTRFSLVMLSSLAQEHWPRTPSLEPDMWSRTPWDAVEIGLLPGRAWSECWRSVSSRPAARPRIGVFDVGWPKADRAFRDPAAFAARVGRLRTDLGLGDRPAVLYAPSFGTEDKQEDFVRSSLDLPVDLLIKQAHWPSENQRQHAITVRHQGLSDRVHVLDPRMNIIDCLALSDVVVSDESTCLVEGLLFGVPAIVPADWEIPAVAGHPPRPCSPPPHAILTDRRELGGAIEATLRDRAAMRPHLERLRDHHFSHIGESADLILDLIEAELDDRPPPVPPLAAVDGPAAVGEPAPTSGPDGLSHREIAAVGSISGDRDPGPIVVEEWGPARVELGSPFNVQPPGPVVEMVRAAVEEDGLPSAWLEEIARPRSALWFRTVGATHETVAYLDGEPLRTWVTIDGDHVTAPVSDGLLGAVGPHVVELRDRLHGRTSGRLTLEVVPPAVTPSGDEGPSGIGGA